MTRLSFRFAKRKSTAWCRWALRFVCCILAAAVSVDIPAEERGTGAVVSLDHSAADLKVPPDAGVIPVPGTDPIRIAVITFALPRDNLLIAEATKLALAPLFPNRGIKLIFCTFEEFDRIVLSRGAEFILGTSGAVTRLSTFGLRPLATLVSKGGPDPNRNEGSAVIVREDHREFQTLGDLKGRTIAASNALSFPGWRAEVLARRQGERVRELMEQKMAQASRLASMQRAASLTQISSIFAHELRQPLTSASLYAEGLARQIRRGSADPDRMAKIADRIADETQRASEIVERVRAYAKGRRLERSVLSAADVMQSAVRLWRGQSMRDFPLWVLVPKSAAHISANAFELELVFVNLLKNAAEAAQAAWAPSGKPQPVNLTKAPEVLVGSGPLVAFTAEVIGSSVVFMVADSGKPLSDEELVRIEAGSSQPQAGSSQKSNGLGLGLAIVRSIVEACFGAITFGRTGLNPRLTGLAVRVALPLVSTSQSGRAQTDNSIPVPHEPAAESAQSLPKDPKDPSK